SHLIFVGHSIIPHHHHTISDNLPNHRQHQCDNDDEHLNDNLLEVIYSRLAHTGSQAIYGSSDINYLSCTKRFQHFNLQSILFFGGRDLNHYNQSDPKVYISHHLDDGASYHSSQYLRGPPYSNLWH
ncbi:MAG: hypothetical protein L0G05_08855, partial [Chryseobacterium sp.]|nr:hypothetical protein [Chryseobacterium sp.]